MGLGSTSRPRSLRLTVWPYSTSRPFDVRELYALCVVLDGAFTRKRLPLPLSVVCIVPLIRANRPSCQKGKRLE